MNEGLIPARYAKALYEFAMDKSADKRIYDIMKHVVDAFADMPALQTTLANPFVNAADKTSLILAAANIKPTQETVFDDFVKLLAQNNRLEFIRQIANAYISLYRKNNHIFDVRLTSAAQLPQDEINRITDIVRRHLGKDATIELTSGIDPELIGGFTLSVANERLDASISNELKQLRLNLLR